jgi:hypothetical protein
VGSRSGCRVAKGGSNQNWPQTYDGGRTNSRPSTRLGVLSSLIRLDIESFYTVSKQLLDRSADLFKFVFNIRAFNPKPTGKPERGSTFSLFAIHFATTVQNRKLTAHAHFERNLLNLRKSIVKYRNNWLEHFEEFGRGRGINGTQIKWSHKSTDAVDIKTEPPGQLLLQIQEYLLDFVDLIDKNLDKSALPTKI